VRWPGWWTVLPWGGLLRLRVTEYRKS